MDVPPGDIVPFDHLRDGRRKGEPSHAGEGSTGRVAPGAAGGDGAGGGGTRPPDPPEESELAREAMMRRLDHLVREDSPPRSIDDELAVLVYDSSAMPLEAFAGVRAGAGSARHLSFQGPDIGLEVHLEPGPELTCQVVPPQPSKLEVRHSNGVIELGPDELGLFHLPGAPTGSVSLRCVPLAGVAGPTATSWISLSS